MKNNADSNVIPGFRKMSKQRIFNLAVAHIAKTRKKSEKSNGCVYSGSGCNAAPLLANASVRAHCDRKSGGSNWRSLVESNVVPSNNATFISELQLAHDSAYADDFMNNWKHRMTNLAARWKLNTSTLDKVEV